MKASAKYIKIGTNSLAITNLSSKSLEVQLCCNIGDLINTSDGNKIVVQKATLLFHSKSASKGMIIPFIMFGEPGASLATTESTSAFVEDAITAASATDHQVKCLGNFMEIPSHPTAGAPGGYISKGRCDITNWVRKFAEKYVNNPIQVAADDPELILGVAVRAADDGVAHDFDYYIVIDLTVVPNSPLKM